MRGITELEVLKAIEAELPRRIPIQRFFDLMVGTRYEITDRLLYSSQSHNLSAYYGFLMQN